jgi:centrin-1
MVESYEKTLEKAVQAFILFDVDGDGKITAKEIESAMGVLGQFVNHEEALEIIAKLDKDNSGTIDFKEFLEYIKGPHRKISKTALWAAFKANDDDNTGFIGNGRISEILNELGIELNQQEIEDFFKVLDPEGCGRSHYDLFENSSFEISWLY